MSRLKQFALTLVVAVCAASAAQAGTVNMMQIGSASANPGDSGVQIDIALDLDAPGGGLSLLNYTIGLGTDTTLCSELSNLGIANSSRVTGTTELFENCPGTGSVTINVADILGAVIVQNGTGTIMTLSFDIAGTAPPGIYPLAVSNLTAQNGPAVVGIETTAGQLEILGPATPTATATAEATNTPDATNTPAATDTPTEVPPPATNTPTSAPPTDTPTSAPPTDTPTIAPPTDTPTEGPTATETNTPTATNTPTITNTPVDTATEGPASTPTATRTRAPIPVVSSPTSPSGMLMIAALALALFWALRRANLGES